ncbi:MAG TPA: c-type cytochrome [Pyrinomonadaceae bacterium]|jgi:mono/diheme cytochrome c family protein|nr:c-type cytochrome [Pyrinomonadaceae bacterium]
MRTSLKKIVLGLALSACAVNVALSARASIHVQENKTGRESASVSPERLARAKTLFAEKCARCHGADGRGRTVTGDMLGVPDFTDENWWKGDRSDARLITLVTEGRDEMPPFGRKLTRREIAALVAYVRRFNKSADTPQK